MRALYVDTCAHIVKLLHLIVESTAKALQELSHRAELEFQALPGDAG
jgi:hypothetical protein